MGLEEADYLLLQEHRCLRRSPYSSATHLPTSLDGESSLHRDLPVQSLMRVWRTTLRCRLLPRSKRFDQEGGWHKRSPQWQRWAGYGGSPRALPQNLLNAAQGYMDIEISLFPFDGAFLFLVTLFLRMRRHWIGTTTSFLP